MVPFASLPLKRKGPRTTSSENQARNFGTSLFSSSHYFSSLDHVSFGGLSTDVSSEILVDS